MNMQEKLSLAYNLAESYYLRNDAFELRVKLSHTMLSDKDMIIALLGKALSETSLSYATLVRNFGTELEKKKKNSHSG